MSMACTNRSVSSRLALRRPALTITCAGMSRQYTMVSWAMGQGSVSGACGGICGCEERRQAVETGKAALAGEAETGGGFAGGPRQRLVLDLGEVHDAPVVAEVGGQEFGMTIQAEPPDHQPFEMPDEIV